MATASGDVFGAIATPVRREILAMLAQRELPVSTLAGSFDMTLSAVSQHLGVLRDAGLVNVRKDGKQRYYRLEPGPLETVSDWVDKYKPFWTEKLVALGEYLDKPNLDNSFGENK